MEIMYHDILDPVSHSQYRLMKVNDEGKFKECSAKQTKSHEE